MHCEHLVVQVGIEDLAVWQCELQANQYGFDATNEEEEHSSGHVHQTEFFVIDSKYPLAPAFCDDWTLDCTHC